MSLPTSDLKNSPASARSRNAAVVVLTLLVLLGFYWRDFIASGGTMVWGELHDASFINNIHEQLFRAFMELRSLRDLAFYYPSHGVLGYSDSFLLDLIFYVPLRLSGVDPFLSYEITIIALTALGFLSYYLILRVLLRIDSVVVAAIAAAVASAPNNFVTESIGYVHGQQFSASFIPLAALLLLPPIVRPDLFLDRPSAARCSAVMGGALYGLTFSTTFYAAWFSGIYAAIIVAIMVPILMRDGCLAAVARRVGIFPVWGLAGFMPALAVFGYIYADAIRTFGGRGIADFLIYAQSASDVLNVGVANYAWGWLVNKLYGPIGQGGHILAITPVLLLSSFAAALYWFRQAHAPAARAFACAVPLALIAIYLLTSRFGDWTPFEYAYRFIPGASAIRVGMRSQIMGSALAAIVVAMAVSAARVSRTAYPLSFVVLFL